MKKLLSHILKLPACSMILIPVIIAGIILSCSPSVELSPEMENILTYKFGESRENLTVIEDMVRASYEKAEERLNIEMQFAELLCREDATYECKDFVCRQLCIIGTEVSVPAIAPMLIDAETSDIARYALEQNPCPEASEAFRNALESAQGLALVGVINSVGARGDKEAVSALEKCTASTDKAVASAAANALAKING